ncbi:hypothetical protein O1L55_08615 [Streptomyces albulus]|nr:hypothetical protein [Streptomyces noursei]
MGRAGRPHQPGPGPGAAPTAPAPRRPRPTGPDAAPTGPGRPTRPALAGNSRRPHGVEPVPRRSLAERLPSTRIVAAAVSLVLGIGLMGGAAAGSWLTESPPRAPRRPRPPSPRARTPGATPRRHPLPRTVEGLAAGPGGADRTWIRIAVAPTPTAPPPPRARSPRNSPRPAAPACCAPPTSTPPAPTSSPSAPRPPRRTGPE